MSSPVPRRAVPALLLFDVDGTLLDLAPVRAAFCAVVPGPDNLRLWCTTLLHYATSLGPASRGAPLPETGVDVLRLLADGRGIALDEEQAAAALHPGTRLPPYPDAIPALERLRAAGFRLAALSNSTRASLRAQLAYSGLAPLFDAAFSADDAGVGKPHPDVYLHAVRSMDTSPGAAMLVASRGWDAAGAAWAGLQSAFIRRPGQGAFLLGPAPDFVLPDLHALADVLDHAGTSGPEDHHPSG